MRDALWKEMKDYAVQYQVPILRDAELPLFCSLVRRKAPVHVLEIGTAIGYSTLRIASCLAASSTITTLELDHQRVMAAKKFIAKSQYQQQIELLEGDGTVLLDQLDGPWDFVFLDGPKGQYSRQLQKIMPKLLPGAMIAADNIRYHDMLYIGGTLPHKHRTAVSRLREFLTMIEDETRFESVFLENGDGMTVSRWKG